MKIYNYADAILLLRPEAVFTIHKNEYSTLEWNDVEQSKPTEEEIQEKIEELEAAEPMRLLRMQRNQLLAETDWMANSDVVMTDEWRAYRQALRDLPANSQPQLDDDGNLINVTWPTSPEDQ